MGGKPDRTAQRAPVRCCRSDQSCAVCATNSSAVTCELTSLTPSAVTTTSAGGTGGKRHQGSRLGGVDAGLRNQLPGHGAVQPLRQRQGQRQRQGLGLVCDADARGG